MFLNKLHVKYKNTGGGAKAKILKLGITMCRTLTIYEWLFPLISEENKDERDYIFFSYPRFTLYPLKQVQLSVSRGKFINNKISGSALARFVFVYVSLFAHVNQRICVTVMAAMWCYASTGLPIVWICLAWITKPTCSVFHGSPLSSCQEGDEDQIPRAQRWN